jgi:hypothetical protein
MHCADTLTELPYAEWAHAEREQRRMKCLGAAERLAALLVSQSDYERAAYWANTTLAKDPLWDNAYALLMETH